MIPLIVKTDKGWRCLKCSLDIVGMKDAETHGIFFHRILPDHFAQDQAGNYYDTTGIDPRTLLRGIGAI